MKKTRKMQVCKMIANQLTTFASEIKKDCLMLNCFLK